MPNVNETVAGLTITAKTEGVDQAKKQVEGLTQSTEQLGVVSQQTSKGAQSLEETWKRATLRFDEGARSQAAFASQTKLTQDAVRNGLATQQQATEHLARVAERYGQASAASKAFAAATSGVSAQLVALSAGAGPVGTFLSALGPWGIAASVGIGALAAVFDRLDEGAKRVGDKSIELKKFSDVTGLSVTEIKGLTKAGAELGVSSDDITTSVERFSIGLFEARKGSGALFDQVNKINPALARQLAEATSTAQGWDVLAQAIKGATDAAQRNALARAAFSRGGIETGLVAAATVDQGGVAKMGEQIAKNTGLTQEWVKETARLRQENIELEKATTAAMDAAFALPMLQRQNEYLRTLKEIADLTIKGGGFKAPGAEDFGAPFANYLSPPVAPLSQRGPSEGAMQAQQEAAAQREVVKAIEDANKAREYAVSVEKMLVTLAQDAAEAEKRKAAVFAENAATYSNVSATTAQTLAQLKDQLNVASAVGVTAQIEAQHRATINDLMRQGKSLGDATAVADAQRAITLSKIEAQHQVTMESLRGQLSVARQITGLGKIKAQYEADINNLLMQGLNLSQATAEAEMRRAIALAQVNTQAKQQLRDLQNQYQVLQAAPGLERDKVVAAQEYIKLLERGVEKQTALAIAAQMVANAEKERANQHAITMVSLQGQLSVAQQITGLGQINAQYYANINNLLMQGLNILQATAQAEMQRAISLAQVNAEADRTLKNLQNEGELIRASSEEEKDRIKARQEYVKLIEEGVTAERASAIASQMQANARATRDAADATESWSVQMDNANDAINRVGQSTAMAADEMQSLANAAEGALKFMTALPLTFGTPLMNPYQMGKDAWDKGGQLTQFNPAGYTSLTSQAQTVLFGATNTYGEGGFDIKTVNGLATAVPNAQGLERVLNASLGGGGGAASSMSGLLSGLSSRDPSMVQNSAGLLSRLTNLLPEDQKAGVIQQQISALGMPTTLAGQELLKQLNDQLKQLTEATSENTSATQTMTDVLSPFYSSDPRRTHLGFRAFREGGIMTQYGELPLRHYQGGGMATSPQVAVFGEGSTPEAYVPVPSGRIPVEIKTPANSNQRPINVTINVQGNADAGTVAALKSTAFQQAQSMRRVMR